MDPITAAALTSLAGSLGGEAGRNAWQGLAALVRRPVRRSADEESGEDPVTGSGEAELAALQREPDNTARAQALATALGVRAALDDEFHARLEQWGRGVGADTGGAVHDSIDGGTQNGPVLQARDLTNLTFDLRRE